ncbi:Protein FMP42 like protein [Verticillium longisporum]|uniref:Protein FMP42 like protein n=1 Tax=Verticillium longisporum TaxID=100787 RepID=A0A8I3A047_VERLO|nr:Protein FMP42 like protein [Verticillium longisporum]
MSLAQHVTQSEGFDYEAPPPCPKPDVPYEDVLHLSAADIACRTEYRRLSFDAFAPHDAVLAVPQHKEPRLAAYKISDLKRFVQVATAIVTCWLASGIVFGFAALKPVLIAEGFDAYLLGNFCLGVGGAFVFVPSFQLSNAFPQYSGVVVALVTGAFDASAAVFLFYRMAYDATGGNFSLEKFFFGYLIVPVLILVAEYTYMPEHAYHSVPELEEKIERAEDNTRDVHTSDDDLTSDGERYHVRSIRAERRRAKLDAIVDLTGDAEVREERVKIKEERLEASGVWGVLHGLPAHQQMLTPWFILILLLTVHQMLRMNYLIATIRAQSRFMLGSDVLAESINHFFDAALPIGGVAATPFIAVLLNNASVPVTFGILTVLIIVVAVLNCIPQLWAGYAMIVAFVIFRPLYYSAISDYATKVFGFATFGRIYGALVCISGIISFAQSGLDAWTHGPLHGNPVPVNIMMGATGTVLGIALVLFVAIKVGLHNEREKAEADMERMPLICEEEEGYGTRGDR